MSKTARVQKPTPSAATRLEKQGVLQAVRACENKKAADIALLEIEKGTSAFTDYFVICSGSNPRQMQAISDEVEEKLRSAGLRPTHVEGYNQAEWILLDYVDFVVHIFSEATRKFYDLERLWKSAKRIELADLEAIARKPPGRKQLKPKQAGATARKPRLVEKTRARSNGAARKHPKTK